MPSTRRLSGYDNNNVIMRTYDILEFAEGRVRVEARSTEQIKANQKAKQAVLRDLSSVVISKHKNVMGAIERQNGRSLSLPYVPQNQRLWYDASRDAKECNGIDETPYVNENGSCKRTQSFMNARMVHRCRKNAPINRYLEPQPHESYLQIVRDSLPVAQELALTLLVVSYHKALLNDVDLFCERTDCSNEEWYKMIFTMLIIVFTMTAVVAFSKHDDYVGDEGVKSRRRTKRDRVLVRIGDLVMLVAILRAVSSLMRSLTASFSSDTVSSLVTTGWVIHLFACDYDFANGKCGKGRDLSLKREKFKGGHTSLSGALLSTTLLASRLSSDVHTFMFVSTSMILFAFYPAHRADIAMNSSIMPTLLVTFGMCIIAYNILDETDDKKTLLVALVVVCFCIPGIKYWLQQFKKIIIGPWTVVQVPHS